VIVDAEKIIKNKPKDCILCPKSLCEAASTTKVLQIYYNNSTHAAIYPPCVFGGFTLVGAYSNISSAKKYPSLREAIDDMLTVPNCELEEALQLTKIKNMIDNGV